MGKISAGRGWIPCLAACLVAGATLQASAPEMDSWTRVRLFSGRPVRAVRVQCPDGLRLPSGRRRAPLLVRANGSGVVVNGAPGVSRRMNGLLLSAGGMRDMTVQAGSQAYGAPGLLRITASNGSLLVVNYVPVELYVLGIVEPELGSLDLPAETLKAQIVASRSYLLSIRGRHVHDGYDFCDGPHCQTYRGTSRLPPALLAAGAAVRGVYLSFAGRPVPAFYHDNCGGATASAHEVWPVRRASFLRTVRDGPGEAYCRFAPKARWRFRADPDRLCAVFRSAGLLSAGESLAGVQVVRRDSSGRAKILAVQGLTPRLVSARRVRYLINRSFGSEVLPSTLFSIEHQGGRYVVTGRGWGHGVGLCQWGAIEMGKEGRRYAEILSHYFPGAGLNRLPERRPAGRGPAA